MASLGSKELSPYSTQHVHDEHEMHTTQDANMGAVDSNHSGETKNVIDRLDIIALQQQDKPRCWMLDTSTTFP